VEFALVVVLLLPLLLGIVEFGRAWYTLHILQTAAREGARVCALTVGPPSSRIEAARQRIDAVRQGVVGEYEVDYPDPATPGTWGYGAPLRVVVRQHFTSVAGSFVPALNGGIELRGSAVFNQEL